MGFGGLFGKSTTTYTDEEILSSSVKSQLGLSADATPSDAFSLLNQNLSISSKIAIGNYNGNGQYGQDHPNTLTFDFEPKFFFIMGQKDTRLADTAMMWIRPNPYLQPVETPSSPFYGCYMSTSGNTLSWYTNSSSDQFNSEGYKYYYLALG